MLGRLITLFRGLFNETTASIADANALRILDQQVRDAEGDLQKAQFDLAGLIGKSKMARDNVAELEAKFARDFETGQRAVAAGRDDLAQEVAGRLSTLEAELVRRRAESNSLTAQETRLRESVDRIRTKIGTMKREIETVKVTESVQRAQSAIVSHGAGANGRLNSAADSLLRIKERQAGTQATFEAAEQLEDLRSGGDLDRRLASAGLVDGPGDASSMLARLKSGNSTPALTQTKVAGALPAPGPRDDGEGRETAKLSRGGTAV